MIERLSSQSAPAGASRTKQLYSKSAPELPLSLTALPGELKGAGSPLFGAKPLVRGSVLDGEMRDKKMGVAGHFGTHLAKRMRENELKPAKVAQSDVLRHLLHMYSDCDDINLTEFVDKLNDEDLWRFVQQ